MIVTKSQEQHHTYPKNSSPELVVYLVSGDIILTKNTIQSTNLKNSSHEMVNGWDHRQSLSTRACHVNVIVFLFHLDNDQIMCGYFCEIFSWYQHIIDHVIKYLLFGKILYHTPSLFQHLWYVSLSFSFKSTNHPRNHTGMTPNTHLCTKLTIHIQANTPSECCKRFLSF